MTLFAPDSFWNADISVNTPADPDSAQIVEYMLSMMGPAQLGREAMAFYDVPADQADVSVTIHAKGRPDTAPRMLELVKAFETVPIPDDVQPAGGDQWLVIRQGNQVWEMEKYAVDPSTGERSCHWAGYINDVTTHPGVYRNVYLSEQDAEQDRNAAERSMWGVSASGFPAYAGGITVDELNSGQIDHAVRLLVPYARQGVHAFPAQRQDGLSRSPHAPVEGMKLQIDGSVDFSSLAWPGNVIAFAGQRKGIVVCDQTHDGTVFSLQTQHSAGQKYPSMAAKGIASEFWTAVAPHLWVLQMDLRDRPDNTRYVLEPPTP